MTRFDIASLRSYALAAFVSLYASIMLVAIAGRNGAEVGPFIL